MSKSPKQTTPGEGYYTMAERETGMLDVGTHCAFCRQIDFLPFHCTRCGKDYCGPHRLPIDHQCPHLAQTSTSEPVEIKSNGGKYFQSLLPAKGSERAASQPHKKPQAENVKIRDTISKSSLNKILSFFKSNSTSRTGKKSKPVNKNIELLDLRKKAVGDANIPTNNRIYVWCHVIDENENSITAHPLYINKMWPVGRALDNLATHLKVKNPNSNIDVNEKDKLYIYKKRTQASADDDIINLDPSNRVANAIFNLDTLYLVRGEDNVQNI